MEGLKLEWEHILPCIKGKELKSVYFGGGTPWLIGPENIQIILERIKDTFSIDKNIEITLEANPENVTLDIMQAYAKVGINRISIGIQSLDNQLLQTLGRQHSAIKAVEAVKIAYASNIKNISIDLMYDLPNQTLTTWKKTLEGIKELPITHLSLYNLTFEPHTAFYKHKNTLQKLTPDEHMSLEMYHMAVNMLQDYGLQQYEISAFAKDNLKSVHNTGYWLARPFLGLGPSAFSDWNGSRFQNVANLSKYVHALKEGKNAIDFKEKLDPASRRRELLAIQMRLLEGVNIHHFQNLHGPLDETVLKNLDLLVVKKLLEGDSDTFKLTQQGILFYDTIAAEII